MQRPQPVLPADDEPTLPFPEDCPQCEQLGAEVCPECAEVVRRSAQQVG